MQILLTNVEKLLIVRVTIYRNFSFPFVLLPENEHKKREGSLQSTYTHTKKNVRNLLGIKFYIRKKKVS
jgi:hypothetical protein